MLYTTYSFCLHSRRTPYSHNEYKRGSCPECEEEHRPESASGQVLDAKGAEIDDEMDQDG